MFPKLDFGEKEEARQGVEEKVVKGVALRPGKQVKVQIKRKEAECPER